jgi:pseudaminic acid cytidylyltransferase
MKIAIIPARGGSKRIPRKNIRAFSGEPIISYSIKTAIESGLFDKVVVSTDDQEVAEIARLYGADTPFLRPAVLADDHKGTRGVINHALSWFRDHDEVFETACCIYATAPFLQVEHLREGLDKLEASGRSFAFSVTSFEFPIQRSLRITGQGFIEAINPEYIFARSQDLEPAYHDAGQFYWGSSQAFLQSDILFSEASVPVILPRYLVHDIDTLEDWRRAEIAFEVLRRSGEVKA